MADTPEPTFKKGDPAAGPGQGEQLPQGEAQDLNAAKPPKGQPMQVEAEQQAGQAQDQEAGLESLPPVQYAAKPSPGSYDQPTGDDALLFGPTDRPNEHVTTQDMRPGEPPQAGGAWMSALAAASQDPDAPQNLKDLMALVNHFTRERG